MTKFSPLCSLYASHLVHHLTAGTLQSQGVSGCVLQDPGGCPSGGGVVGAGREPPQTSWGLPQPFSLSPFSRGSGSLPEVSALGLTWKLKVTV